MRKNPSCLLSSVSVFSTRSAFTLVELMIVIAIIGVLSASLFPMVSGYLARARNTARDADIRKLYLAIESYKSDTGMYPTGQEYTLNTSEMISSNSYSWTGSLGQQLQMMLPKMPTDTVKGLSYYYGVVQDSRGGAMVSTNPANGHYGDGSASYVLYAQKELLPSWQNFKSTFLSASSSTASSDFPAPVTVKDTGSGVKKYSVIGNSGFESKDLIPIDPSQRYRISVEVRSVGTTQSHLYFGISNYDRNQEWIAINRVLTNGNAPTISSYTDTSITTSDSITGWNNAGSQSYSRMLGFYYDGDTTQVPRSTDLMDYQPSPFSYNTLPNWGAYSTAGGTTIQLNTPIPNGIKSQIIPGVTKVMDHSWGGRYQYLAVNVLVPNTWTTYSFDMTGEDLTGPGTYGSGLFRKGTRYIKFLLLGNHGQGGDTELQFDNLKIERL